MLLDIPKAQAYPRLVRLLLTALLAFWTPFAQATEPSFDALSHLFHTYAGPTDEKAAEAAPEEGAPPEGGARLAQISSDLSLMAEGLETFRHPDHARHALKELPDHIVPELRPFFKDRNSALATIYRTLAVTDYTWALRFPEPACEPGTRRGILLSSKDGLFAAPKSGAISPWLSRLLGPAAAGRTAQEALDRASLRDKLSVADYELTRVRIARITEALNSDKAVGKERAKLYCLRAEAHEALASAHQSSQDGPIQASRAIDHASLYEKEAGSILLIAVEEGPARLRAVGAGVMVETPQGPKVLSDARLMPAHGEEHSLQAFARRKDGTLDSPRALLGERADTAAGVMVGRLQDGDGIPALKIARDPAVRRDFIRAVGHMSASGAWTVSQGLVTQTGDGTFASDAILGPDMLGSPLLNAEGEIVGLVVLSPGAGTPAAINTVHLTRIVDGTGPTERDLEFVASRQTGSASLLTTARPLTEALSVPGGGAVEAGLPNSLGGVNWSSGGGVGNWRPRNSAGAPSGYSSSGSSSYGPGAAATGAEIGQALGEAMAPLVEALIFKGIPMLFRGIGSLFKSKPRASKAPVIRAMPPATKVAEKPKPKPEITVKFEATTIAVGEKVEFVLTATSDSPEVNTAGIRFNFTAENDMETRTGTAVTDESGTAMVSITPSPAARSFTQLQKESDRHTALINTGRETNAERICKIILPGSLALGTLTVTMLAASTPPGMILVYGGGAQCATAASGLMLGAGVFCTIEFGKDAFAQSIQPAAPSYTPPATIPKPVMKAESAIDEVRKHAKASYDDLEAAERDHTDEAPGRSTNEQSGGQSADPNEPPKESETKDSGQVKPKKGEFLKKLSRAKSKGNRTRWKDEKGKIYEWDSQHGELEVYNSRGKHIGVRDPETGKWIKSAKPGRTIEP